MDLEDKQRVSLYLDKETVKTVDVFIKKHGYRSRNELFETAAKNMIADSALKSSDDILSDKLAKAIENVSEELEDMRREAVNNVRRTRGKIKLEDIAKGWYNEE